MSDYLDAGWDDYPPAGLVRANVPNGLKLDASLRLQRAWRMIIVGRLRAAQGGGLYEHIVGRGGSST